MKDLKPESIRNIVLLSYNGAGKTSLVEAILAAAGAIAQMGSTAAGTTAMDYEPEEHHRKLSVHASLCQLAWNDTGLNLIDTPGAPSFYADARQATYVADSAVWVLNAAADVKSDVETPLQYA